MRDLDERIAVASHRSIESDADQNEARGNFTFSAGFGRGHAWDIPRLNNLDCLRVGHDKHRQNAHNTRRAVTIFTGASIICPLSTPSPSVGDRGAS